MIRLRLLTLTILALSCMSLRAEQLTDSVRVHFNVDRTEIISEDSDVSEKQPEKTGGYVFALKSNLLYDALATPSIGVEFPIGKHFSVGANWMYAWWQNRERNRHWRIYGGDINARYYFGKAVSNRRQSGDSKSPLQGHHVGVYGQVLLFQIAFGGKGYITGVPGENILGRPWWGGGVEYGYSRQIGKRLNIDFSLGLGYMRGEYNTYRPTGGCYVWQSTHREKWFGPTKAEISLMWLIGPMERRLEASGIQKGGDE